MHAIKLPHHHDPFSLPSDISWLFSMLYLISDFEGLQVLEFWALLFKPLYFIDCDFKSILKCGHCRVRNLYTLCCIKHFQGLIFNRPVNQVFMNLYAMLCGVTLV